MRSCLVGLVAVFVGANAQAQFTPGDLYLISTAIPANPGSQSAIVRIVPATWSTTPTPTGVGTKGRAVFDASRNAIVFSGFSGLYTMDAAGAISPAALPAPPTADHPASGVGGVLYYSETSGTGTLGYLDNADVAHALLAPDGSSQAAVLSIDALWYDGPTHALFAADNSVAGQTRISRLTLNAAGDQVVAVDTTLTDVSAAAEIAVGFSAGPGSSIFLKVDDNSNSAAPRMLLIDPATLAVSTYATSEYFGVAGEVAGAYAPALGRAVVLDSLGDILRTFALGESGEGAAIGITGVSSGGASGELAQLIVIPPDPCPTDLSGDGVTDGADLGLLLGAWGSPCPLAGPICPPDMNGDGNVDGADLGLLLGAWGMCP